MKSLEQVRPSKGATAEVCPGPDARRSPRRRWKALHASLVRAVTTLRATRHFEAARAQHAVLAPYENPSVLISYLTSKDGSPDEKDAVYGALLEAVQRRDAWSETAMAILLCGLWPGLDSIYWRRQRHFRRQPEELVESISIAFTELVARLDLTRVRRVAATLVRSTDRDVLEQRRRDWADCHRQIAISEEDKKRPELITPPRRESDLGLPVGLSPDNEMAALRAWLLPICGVDTDLLIAVVVLGVNQREAGVRIGLTHQATRKRCQRALDRVLGHLSRKRLSHLIGEPRVSRA